MTRDFEWFKNEISRNVSDRLGDDVHFERIVKTNDIVLTGMVLDSSPSVCVYLEPHYDDYVTGKTIEEVTSEVMRDYITAFQKQDPFIEKAKDVIHDNEKFRNNVVMKLVGADDNREYLAQRPHRNIAGGLALCYEVDLSENAAIGIDRNVAMMAGMTEPELHALAEKNTPRLRPAVVAPLGAVLDDIVQLEKLGLEHDTPGMLIISNSGMVNGAAAVLYPGVMEKVSEIMSGDFYILPSSIHETIAVLDTGGDPVELQHMVSEVNSATVQKADKLSDAVYKYDSKKREIVMAVTGDGRIPGYDRPKRMR